MKTKIIIKDHKNTVEAEHLKSDIKFEAINFHYPKGESLFENFNATIPFGSTIGIVGDTGSGKTTIAKLLLRLYDPIGGTIRIGEHDIKNIPLEILRANIGIVSQETYLFNASIRENITYGLDIVKDEAVVKATKDSYSFSFINSLKNGFDTIVGERGLRLNQEGKSKELL